MFIMCNWFIGDILPSSKINVVIERSINHNYIQLENLFAA